LDDFLDGGGAGTNFSDCNMDGGAVISGKTSSIIDGGDGAARLLQGMLDGGKTLTNFPECTTDGGAVVQDDVYGSFIDGGEGAARLFEDMLDGGGAN